MSHLDRTKADPRGGLTWEPTVRGPRMTVHSRFARDLLRGAGRHDGAPLLTSRTQALDELKVTVTGEDLCVT